ncbi:hypothetical protein EDC04DRAFT_2625863 [Pisolithus marmoratus]|nr:hypothetical protein EDC04DRAFT_2625863 [Pisolithus marmoratus]
MPPRPEFSTLFPTREVESDAPACHVHYCPLPSDCSPPDEHVLQQRTGFGLPTDRICNDFRPGPSCASDMPTTSAALTFHVDYSKAAAVFGHNDCVQSATNYYDMPSEPSYSPNPGPVSPAYFIPSMVSAQATKVNALDRHPALTQGHLGSFGSNASADVTAGASVGSLTSATMTNFLSEAPQTYSFPAQLTNPVALKLPQVTSQSVADLKPCEWKDNKGEMCGKLVGWHCQDHLGSVHGIVNISSSTPVTCGACDERMKRKSILRHFRERHLGFRRSDAA